MIKKQSANAARLVRHARVRKKISGTASKPRLNVFRSNQHISVQIIDDTTGHTLVAASTMEKEFKETGKNGGNIEAAKVIGALVARRALEKGITTIVFDRGGYLYHGRVAALATAAREAGLQF